MGTPLSSLRILCIYSASSASSAGRHPPRINTITHYTGDVRIKYLQVLENFHNKVLDTVFHCNKNQSYELSDNQILQCMLGYINAENCSLLVYATGFESAVPGVVLDSRSSCMHAACMHAGAT